MLKKRLGAVVFVKDGLVVQSIGFKKYLPIGKPETIVKNLDNWGADEIILLNVDSNNLDKPNLKMIENVTNLNIRTPLIYGGGIKKVEDAVNCIKLGSDRVVINQLYLNDVSIISKISEIIGKESLVLSLNVILQKKKFFIYNYLNKKIKELNIEQLNHIYKNYISEVFITDYFNEGKKNSFDFNLIKNSLFKDKKLLVYGGINQTNQFRRLFRYKNVSSVVLGNCLNYKESSIFGIKKECKYGFRK
mgnify:CR=1 FL=1